MKELTLAEKKSALIEQHKDEPEVLTNLISEVVFDITLDMGNRFVSYDIDSRIICEEVRDWAWEFQYDYELTPPEDHDYLTEVDTFAYSKIKELEDRYNIYKIKEN